MITESGSILFDDMKYRGQRRLFYIPFDRTTSPTHMVRRVRQAQKMLGIVPASNELPLGILPLERILTLDNCFTIQQDVFGEFE